jgi:hypothetical protein
MSSRRLTMARRVLSGVNNFTLHHDHLQHHLRELLIREGSPKDKVLFNHLLHDAEILGRLSTLLESPLTPIPV